MLNSVPESMRACLIEAAKLAGPAFKRKTAEQQVPAAAAGAGAAGGPLSFNISVDAGRGPPVVHPAAAAAAADAEPLASFPSAGAMATAAGADAAAAGVQPQATPLPSGESSDPLISGILNGVLASGPLLCPIPSLPPPPLPVGPVGGRAQPGQEPQQGPEAAEQPPHAGSSGGGNEQQLLDLIQ